MKKFNLFAILFAIASVLFFAGCDNDNDKKDGDVTPPAETCFCDEAKTAQCPDGDKAKCETPDAGTCIPVCTDGKECKCEADKCECVEKTAEPVCDPACKENEECKADDAGKTECKPKEVACVCDPVCKEDEDCVKGEADKCECKAKDTKVDECFCDDEKKVACPEAGKDACQPQPPAEEDKCKDKEAGADCGDNKVCTAGDDGKLACADKPADPPADPCKDKAEGDACGDNKTCQKEADALVCKDAAAPTQPDPAE